MSEHAEADEVLMELSTVRLGLHQVGTSITDLREIARGAQSTLDDVEHAVARARVVEPRAHATPYLLNAGEQMDVLRQRCVLASSMAEEIEDGLNLARLRLESARDRLNNYAPDPHSPGDSAALAELRTRTEDLATLIDLAAPLARSVHTHLKDAAETAAALTTPSAAESQFQSAAYNLDRGTHGAGRSVARADASVEHLDRSVASAGATVLRSLAGADAVAAAAQARMRAGQNQPPPTLAPPPRPGPSR